MKKFAPYDGIDWCMNFSMLATRLFDYVKNPLLRLLLLPFIFAWIIIIGLLMLFPVVVFLTIYLINSK